MQADGMQLEATLIATLTVPGPFPTPNPSMALTHCRDCEVLCQRYPLQHSPHLLMAGRPHPHAQASAAHWLYDLRSLQQEHTIVRKPGDRTGWLSAPQRELEDWQCPLQWQLSLLANRTDTAVRLHPKSQPAPRNSKPRLPCLQWA